MATQEKYQGWANWETWNVALWFANDYGLYQAVRAHPEKFTAANVKSFVKHHLPDGTPDFKGGRSYSKVDWKEIVDDFNEMRGDGVSETRGAWHPRVRAVKDERPYVQQHATAREGMRPAMHAVWSVGHGDRRFPWRHGTSEAFEAVHERPMRAPLREHPYPPPSRRPARPLPRRR